MTNAAVTSAEMVLDNLLQNLVPHVHVFQASPHSFALAAHSHHLQQYISSEHSKFPLHAVFANS